jgi:hypothetical protein
MSNESEDWCHYSGLPSPSYYMKGRFETQNLNNMNKDNKNTELDNSDKKLQNSTIDGITMQKTKEDVFYTSEILTNNIK